jgi:hypothetical protein
MLKVEILILALKLLKKPLECAHGVWHICANLAIYHNRCIKPRNAGFLFVKKLNLLQVKQEGSSSFRLTLVALYIDFLGDTL